MTSILQALLDLLDLEKLEEDLFRGESTDVGGKSVFGGQVLGQALIAACRTVADRRVHSLHAYFLRPGDMRFPIVYRVERIRDGRSFTTRRIVAVQHGEPIFTMMASFQIEEQGFEHQAEMPAVPMPETLPSLVELRLKMAQSDPEKYSNRPDIPIEFRPVQPTNPYLKEGHPPLQKVWFRTVAPLPDDPVLQRCVLAYASDFRLLGTASLPHDFTYRDKNVDMASIDHSMWFHGDFRADQWLLYDMESPSASNARGLAQGKIFTREGRLIATVAQEGLMRVRPGS